MELVVGKQVLLVHSGDNELRVVNFSRVVSVNLLEHFIDFLVVQRSSEELEITVLNFIFGELSITINIHGSENLVNGLFLLLSKQLRGDESISGLLQLGVGIEVLQVGKSVQSNIRLKILSG